MPGARCTRGLVYIGGESHTSIQGSGGIRRSLRNGFTAYIVLSPGRAGLVVTVAAEARLHTNLTPASGRQDLHDCAERSDRSSGAGIRVKDRESLNGCRNPRTASFTSRAAIR